MKKTAILLLLFITSSVTAQNAFYAAKKLHQLSFNDIQNFTKKVANEKKKLSDKKGDAELSAKQIEDWTNINLFMENPLQYVYSDNAPKLNFEVIDELKKQQESSQDTVYMVYENGGTMRATSARNNSKISNLLTGASGSELIPRILDATAQVLLDRAEQELSATYINRLRIEFEKKREIKCDRNKDKDSVSLKDFFPNFYTMLIAENVINMQLGHTFQKVLENDLKNFYANSRELLYKCVDPDTARYVDDFYFAATQLAQGMHPHAIFNELAARNSDRVSSNKYAQAVTLIGAISASLRSETNENVWVSAEEFNKLSEQERKYYFALLILDNKKLFGYFADKQNDVNAAAFAQKVIRLLEYLNQIQAEINTLKETDYSSGNSGNADKATRYFDYASSFFDILELSNDLFCDLKPLIETSKLCTNTLPPKLIARGRKIMEIVIATRQKEYAGAAFATLELVSDVAGKEIHPGGILKYVALANDIVQADSVTEMKKVLDEAIMPVGSYRLKRSTQSSCFLNAYVGMSGGLEWLDDSKIANKWSGHYSPFMPLGFEIAWGSRLKKTTGTQNNVGSSNSLFISAIDIGAIGSYRFQNNDSLKAQSLPKIELYQVFSPGLYYIHGFKNAPLSFGLGVAGAPMLRSIKSPDDVTLSSASAVRISAFLAVDIPMFNLFTSDKAKEEKKEKKKKD